MRHVAEGSKIMKLMSPDGKYLNSRVQALEYMEEKNYEATVMKKVKAFFNKVPIQSELKSEFPVSDILKDTDEDKASSPVKRKIEDSDVQSIKSDSIPPVKKKNWSKFIKGRNNSDWSEGDDTV